LGVATYFMIKALFAVQMMPGAADSHRRS
jgi:hypothetical protein